MSGIQWRGTRAEAEGRTGEQGSFLITCSLLNCDFPWSSNCFIKRPELSLNRVHLIVQFSARTILWSLAGSKQHQHPRNVAWEGGRREWKHGQRSVWTMRAQQSYFIYCTPDLWNIVKFIFEDNRKDLFRKSIYTIHLEQFLWLYHSCADQRDPCGVATRLFVIYIAASPLSR